jgi:hypothetical protein
MKAVLAAALSCLIGAAGWGAGMALAGSGQKAWGCKPSWSAAKCKKHKPPETITLTIPATTPVVTPPVTVTVTTPAPPAQTVTVTTPAPPAETVTVTKTVTTPAKNTSPAKHKKRKKPGVHQVGGRTSRPPKHKGAGVTG